MAVNHPITVKLPLAVLLLASVLSAAQSLPEAPEPKPHHFLDNKTKIELASSAVAISLDGFSTMKVMAYQGPPFYLHEHNPIAQPFVNNRLTASLYFGSSFAAEAGAMYLADKKHLPLVKHFIPWAITGWEMYLTRQNYSYSHRASTTTNCVRRFPVFTPTPGNVISPCVGL